MNRFNNPEQKLVYELIENITTKRDFWSQEEPIPVKIGFQRFGLQLREEDFEPNPGYSYQGFSVRDRSVARKVASGFSVVKNDEKEFKVDLDVWPLKQHELNVMIMPGKYFVIKGEQGEKLEDNSYCSRKFERYYCLPRGTNSESIHCSYSNGILSVVLDKEGIVDDAPRGRIIPITLETNLQSDGVPSKEQSTPPTEIEKRNIILTFEKELGNETNVQDLVSPKEVPATGEGSKVDTKKWVEGKKSYVEAIASVSPKRLNKVMEALELLDKELFKSDGDVEAVQRSTEESEELLSSKEVSDENSQAEDRNDKKVLTSDNVE